MNVVKNGEFRKINNKIFYLSKEKKAFEINCDQKLIEEILQYTNGYYTRNEIINLVTHPNTGKLIDELIDVQFFSFTRKKYRTFFISTDRELSKQVERDLSRYVQVLKLDEIEDYLYGGDLLVAYGRDDEVDFFKGVNRVALLNNTNWIKFSVNYPDIRLGPVFFSDGGPCFECLHNRINSNVEGEKNVGSQLPNHFWQSILLPIIQNEIIRLTHSQNASYLFNTEVTLNLINYKTTHFKTLRMPDCNFCSDRG